VIASFTFSPLFTISDIGSENTNSTQRYTLKELNGRTDYCPSSVSDCSDEEQVKNAIFDQYTTIAWSGSELYHFKATTDVDDDEYCVLTDSFVLYVILAAPRTSTLASTMASTGVAFSLSLFAIYVFQMEQSNK
jgi:hypothetical protein